MTIPHSVELPPFHLVKRCYLPSVDIWVWGIFATRRSRKPYLMSKTVRGLSRAWHARESERAQAYHDEMMGVKKR